MTIPTISDPHFASAADRLHLRLADNLEDSARNWRSIAAKLLDSDLQLAILAHRFAMENELMAQREKEAVNA